MLRLRQHIVLDIATEALHACEIAIALRIGRFESLPPFVEEECHGLAESLLKTLWLCEVENRNRLARRLVRKLVREETDRKSEPGKPFIHFDEHRLLIV